MGEAGIAPTLFLLVTARAKNRSATRQTYAPLIYTEGVQLKAAMLDGILPPGFDRSSVENGILRTFMRVHWAHSCPIDGILECPTCHSTYLEMSARNLAFSPAAQVLQYILNYLEQTDPVNQKPLDEVGLARNHWFGLT